MPAPRNDSSSPVCTFRAESSSRCATSSGSERARSTARSPLKRRFAGRSRKSSWTDETPISASISSRSRLVSESWLTGSLFGDERLVGLGVHQLVRLGRRPQLDADEPALAVRVLVDRLRLL